MVGSFWLSDLLGSVWFSLFQKNLVKKNKLSQTDFQLVLDKKNYLIFMSKHY
jgi:hypothetical protein